jgi:LysR family transcriptional regulator, transcriptional activator of nhaA
MLMSALNYHHLRYFWAIAHERSLTRAAARLHVSQSALSIQLRKLEERLGQRLFDRSNRALVLTEAGKVALDYADSIFEAGDELVGTLKAQHTSQQSVLRVGAVATLSRNFQIDLLRPLLGKASLEIVVRSGSLRELLSQLRNHELDLVLSNQAVKADAHDQWHAHLLDRQPVVLVSKPARGAKALRSLRDIGDTPVLLPSLESGVRAGFDRIADRAGVSVRIAAEVDDMAMLRLLAREHRGLSLVPRIVVQDELREGRLRERFRVPDLDESFFAITQTRRFPNKLVRELLA